MQIKMLLLLLSIKLCAECTSPYQSDIKEKTITNYTQNKFSCLSYSPSIDVEETTFYDFSRTYVAESNNKFDAVNIQDVGKGYSLGIVQFNAGNAKILALKLGITPQMSKKEIQRRLKTPKGKRVQKQMFQKLFVRPVLKFARKKGITNKVVIEFIVDWRVNGMPKSYYNRINKNSTIKDLIALRNARYYRLHKRNPKRFPNYVLISWLKRTASFLK
jgi:hypothetical protein